MVAPSSCFAPSSSRLERPVPVAQCILDPSSLPLSFSSSELYFSFFYRCPVCAGRLCSSKIGPKRTIHSYFIPAVPDSKGKPIVAPSSVHENVTLPLQVAIFCFLSTPTRPVTVRSGGGRIRRIRSCNRRAVFTASAAASFLLLAPAYRLQTR